MIEPQHIARHVFAALLLAPLAALHTASASETQPSPVLYDIVIYGDSSGAVTAAISAKREGRSVILVNPASFPGGMSASGLGATDFGGKQGTFGGIASEFYKGGRGSLWEGFRPHL